MRRWASAWPRRLRLFPSTIATADRNLCAATKLALDYIILGTEIDAPSDKRSGSEEQTHSPFPASLVEWWAPAFWISDRLLICWLDLWWAKWGLQARASADVSTDNELRSTDVSIGCHFYGDVTVTVCGKACQVSGRSWACVLILM